MKSFAALVAIAIVACLGASVMAQCPNGRCAVPRVKVSPVPQYRGPAAEQPANFGYFAPRPAERHQPGCANGQCRPRFRFRRW